MMTTGGAGVAGFSSERGSVVVGVSGTLGSLQALRAAAREAQASRRPLVPVLVWTPPGGDLAARRAPFPDLGLLGEREAMARLARAFDEALGGPPAELAPVPFVVRGHPGPVLLDIADHPRDLLVLGAGEPHWPARLWHGATTRYCLGRAVCPVLSVPTAPLLGALPYRARHRVPYRFDEAEQRADPRIG